MEVEPREDSPGSLEGYWGSILLDPTPPLQHFPGLLDRIHKSAVAQDTLWPHRLVSSHWEDKGMGFASIFVFCFHLAGQGYAAAAVVVPPRKCGAVDVLQADPDGAVSLAVL